MTMNIDNYLLSQEIPFDMTTLLLKEYFAMQQKSGLEKT